jgi:hypothetical protein
MIDRYSHNAGYVHLIQAMIYDVQRKTTTSMTPHYDVTNEHEIYKHLLPFQIQLSRGEGRIFHKQFNEMMMMSAYVVCFYTPTLNKICILYLVSVTHHILKFVTLLIKSGPEYFHRYLSLEPHR